MAQKANVKGNVICCSGPETLQLSNIFADYGYAAYVDGFDDTKGVTFDYMLLPGNSMELYNQQPHETTQFHDPMDVKEIAFYRRFKALKKLGVCRGAQLLNALNGGSMWQNVNNHSNGKHIIEDIKGRARTVSTVHHQMMRPGATACIIAWTRRATMTEEDPEVILYPLDRALCYQPHPEWDIGLNRDYFFDLIEEFLH
jgi:GMP synthase-like glutamine amidotransferase